MIPYMVGKLAPNSSHLSGGLVKYVSGRGYFRVIFFQSGDKLVTSPPPQSLNGSSVVLLSIIVPSRHTGIGAWVKSKMYISILYNIINCHARVF